MKKAEINISFYLKRTSPKKELKKRAVYITIAFRGTQIKMSTGIIIEDPGDYWKSGMFTHPKFYEQNTKMYKIKEQILAYDVTHFKTAEDIRNAYEGIDIDETPLTIFEALDFGIKYKIEEGLQTENTNKSQRCIINKFERFRIAKKAPNWGTTRNHPRMLSRGVVKQFIKWLSDPSNGEGSVMKAATINNYIGVLGANYQAYYKQYIDVEPNLINNPFYGNKIKIDTQESTDKALSKAIDWKWIDAIEGISYKNPVDEKFRQISLLMAYTGLSFVELGKPDALEIHQGMKGLQLRSQRHKTGKDYMVPCNSRIIDIVKKIDYLPWKNWHEDTLENARYRGNCYAQLNNWLDKLSKDIKYNKSITPHIFRHTFAMRMINYYRLPISIVARMLGDKEDMVRKHYAKSTDDTIEDQFESHMLKFEKMNNNTDNAIDCVK